jgi:hypothetical protein
MEALFSLLSNIWWRNALFMFTWTAYILNWNLWAGSATSVVAANLEHEKSRLSRGLGHSQPKILCWCSTSAAISVLQFIHQYLVLSKLTILSFQKCPSPCFLKVMLHTPNDFFFYSSKISYHVELFYYCRLDCSSHRLWWMMAWQKWEMQWLMSLHVCVEERNWEVLGVCEGNQTSHWSKVKHIPSQTHSLR